MNTSLHTFAESPLIAPKSGTGTLRPLSTKLTVLRLVLLFFLLLQKT